MEKYDSIIRDTIVHQYEIPGITVSISALHTRMTLSSIKSSLTVGGVFFGGQQGRTNS